MLEWNLENQAEWLIFISPIFFQVILIWSILLLKTAEQYASHTLLEASLPLGDTGGIEFEPFLRSEVLKASHFLVFLSVSTPDSCDLHNFFFHLSDSEERLHSFSILHLKSSHHVHFMILMGITGETLLMPVPSAISLVSLTLSVAPGVWPSPPYTAPHDGPWCLTSLLLLWGVATGQREPSTNHCGVWRKKTGGLCTSVQV